MRDRKTRREDDVDSRRIAAFFDFDGTVTSVDSFLLMGLYARWEGIGNVSLSRFFRSLADHGAGKSSNHDLKEALLKDLKGLSREQMREFCERLFRRLVRFTLRPVMVSRIAWHNRAGHATVLLSASLTEQLAPAAAFLGIGCVLGSEAQYRDGVLTGFLEGAACHGEEKARRAAEFCRSEGIDTGRCVAYGDALSDVPVLEIIRNACVVNGGRRINKLARKRGWKTIRCYGPVSFRRMNPAATFRKLDTVVKFLRNKDG